MYVQLKDKTNTAIENSKKAYDSCSDKPFHAMKPATTVHELVEELLKYKQESV